MFKDLKFKYKIYIIPVLAVITYLIVLSLTMSYSTKNEKLLKDMVIEHTPAWELNHELIKKVEWIKQGFQDAVAFEDDSFLGDLDLFRERFTSTLELGTGNPNLQSRNWNGLTSLFNTYFDSAVRASGLVLEGKTGSDVDNAMETMYRDYGALEKKLLLNIQDEKERMVTGFNTTRINNKVALVVSAIVIIVSITLIIFVSIYIIQSITGPLMDAIGVAEKVAEGDLSVEVADRSGKDEAGMLIKTIGKMVENLQNLMGQIRESANALAAAAGQITTSVTQIASAATETASAATETSTTVEEVRQTALDSNKKAKNVSESSQKAVEVSQAGEQSVSDTIEGMHRIEAQMSSIAESIMRLSEHGQAIGGIIAIVEDVAEQSRLLAVNASIEAVKAGEQGKGFAVVAQEVSSLADQSKQATSRVRKILDDIQKATSEAVMKTEQGSKAVDAGVKQSAEAGEAIQRLADSVTEASQATTQIAVSSQEQLVGMDQVVSAMESIKKASTQNVSATKQVESAAHDLHTLGQKLKEVLEDYSV